MPHTTSILPTVKLDAGTSGTAKFNLGIDFTIPREIDQDLGFSILYRTSTNDGVTNLFTIDSTPGKSKLPKDWQVGASATFTLLRAFVGVTAANEAATNSALRQCLRDCDGKNKDFCTKAKAALPPKADGSPWSNEELAKLSDSALYPIQEQFAQPSVEYCSDGKDFLKKADSELKDQSAVLPKALLSAGALAGSTHYDFLHVDPADAMHLTPSSSDDPSFSAMASAVYVTDDLLTFELNGRLQTKRIASTKKVKWCVPGGSVDLGKGVMAPSESCDEQPVGDPVRQGTTEFALYVGGVSRTKAFRASAGFFYSRQPSDGSGAKRSYGAKFPILFATDVLPGTGVYKRMLRISPTLNFRETGRAFDSQLLITIEVLTSRSLFGTALDAF